MKFVEKPHLPKGKIKKLIVGEEYCRIIDFKKFGIETVKIPACEDLAAPVRSHADMQVIHLYSNKITVQPNLNCKATGLYSLNDNIICKFGVEKLDIEYPVCASYNFLILNDYVFYNPRSASRTLINELSSDHCMVNAKQGFTRCSVCVVSENAVITADKGIAGAMKNNGIDVLEIEPGNIYLPGYDYGFIGGSSFKLSEYELAFTGSLERLPNKTEILKFLHNHGVRAVYLTDRDLFDIGSAIPIIEE